MLLLFLKCSCTSVIIFHACSLFCILCLCFFQDLALRIVETDDAASDSDLGEGEHADLDIPTSFLAAYTAIYELRTPESAASLSRLKTLCKNAIEDGQMPGHAKFLQIKCSNKVVCEKVLSVAGAFELLLAFGWEVGEGKSGECTLTFPRGSAFISWHPLAVNML